MEGRISLPPVIKTQQIYKSFSCQYISANCLKVVEGRSSKRTQHIYRSLSRLYSSYIFKVVEGSISLRPAVKAHKIYIGHFLVIISPISLRAWTVVSPSLPLLRNNTSTGHFHSTISPPISVRSLRFASLPPRNKGTTRLYLASTSVFSRLKHGMIIELTRVERKQTSLNIFPWSDEHDIIIWLPSPPPPPPSRAPFLRALQRRENLGPIFTFFPPPVKSKRISHVGNRYLSDLQLSHLESPLENPSVISRSVLTCAEALPARLRLALSNLLSLTHTANKGFVEPVSASPGFFFCLLIIWQTSCTGTWKTPIISQDNPP